MTLAVIVFGRFPVITNDGVNISIYHNLPKDFIILFSIGLVMVMILSSIALIISTKVSTGATIGIIIAIGVFIQITGIIGQFSTTAAYDTKFLQSNIGRKTDSLITDMRKSAPNKKSNYSEVAQTVNALYNAAMTNASVTFPKTKK
jgi:hypothetical protein